jgi:tRNA (mo5U34)-methyltransferase
MVTQEDIDRLKWFHPLTFDGGLAARPHERNIFYMKLCAFVAEQLRKLDLAGKRVLDVGCWDGYFSFLAEELGAASVLAVDDFSQNYGTPEAFHLARRLKHSRVTLIPDLSVYQLGSTLTDKFDVILFLGLYYHLHAPMAGLAELRKLCHQDSLVVIEGCCIRDQAGLTAQIDLQNPGAKFVPTARLLNQMLAGAYFKIDGCHYLSDFKLADMLRLLPPEYFLKAAKAASRTRRTPEPEQPHHLWDRTLIIARPFWGKNTVHHYPPPFGLAQFDERFL